MKKKIITTAFIFLLFISAVAQNVGVGVLVPVEKLDVNGNINLSGKIITNGIAGQDGQALMTNSSGNMVWGDLSSYKNFVTFSTVGSGSWIVPAGITKIYAEAWGGGGGGTLTGGGGGGAYIAGIITVTPGGSVSYTVGAGGPAGSPNSSNGGNSTVSFSTAILQAFGGSGISSASFSVAEGGAFNGFNTPHIGLPGEAGGANYFGYHQSNSTTFLESQHGGKGGDAGNTLHTGGKGSYQLRNAATTVNIYTLYGSHGKIPGGGGGGNITWGGSIRNGAQGMVIIRY